MSSRLGTVWYWLGVAVAVALILAAVLWNAWTFNQHSVAQRQLDSLGVDLATASGDDPVPGSPEAAELELLIDADRRGILEESFQALLTEPQKRALAVARHDRVTEQAGDRQISLIFGVMLILGGIVVYFLGRRARRGRAKR
jgi:hypothetical protein